MMTQYPTDETIDQTFPDNSAGDIGADDMRAFQKGMTAAGVDYAAMTENVPGTFPPSAHSHTAVDLPAGLVYPHDAVATYTKDDLVSHEGAIYFAVDDHAPAVFDLANWHAVGAATGSGVTFAYKWSSNIAGQVPSGTFGVTGAPADASNTVRVSTETKDAVDVGLFWANVNIGDYILFIEDSGGAESVLFIVTGAATLQTGAPNWYEIAVDMVTVNGESENNRNAFVSIISNPLSKLPAGGTTGQVLTKTSGADYDVEWSTP